MAFGKLKKIVLSDKESSDDEEELPAATKRATGGPRPSDSAATNATTTNAVATNAIATKSIATNAIATDAPAGHVSMAVAQTRHHAKESQQQQQHASSLRGGGGGSGGGRLKRERSAEKGVVAIKKESVAVGDSAACAAVAGCGGSAVAGGGVSNTADPTLVKKARRVDEGSCNNAVTASAVACLPPPTTTTAAAVAAVKILVNSPSHKTSTAESSSLIMMRNGIAAVVPSSSRGAAEEASFSASEGKLIKLTPPTSTTPPIINTPTTTTPTNTTATTTTAAAAAAARAGSSPAGLFAERFVAAAAVVKTQPPLAVELSSRSPSRGAAAAATGSRKKLKYIKTEENFEPINRWWERTEAEVEREQEKQWEYMEHNGLMFAPPYEAHGIPIAYKGQTLSLPPEAEEVAGFWCGVMESDYAEKPRFINNFWKAFLRLLPPTHAILQDPRHTECRLPSEYKSNEVLAGFAACDFSAIKAHLDRQKELKKALSKEQKEALKQQKQEEGAPYAYALVDFIREKVGNSKVEPPGLFRGRGEHPKQGMLKRRIFSENVILNLAEDAPVPKVALPGHAWKDVFHDNSVTWLAFYRDSINDQVKYMYLAAQSKFKGQQDFLKYEKARKLKLYVDKIRKDYFKKMESTNPLERQLGTATYLIDFLALRIGGEKDTDEEADTVGCCSLRVEHLTFEKESRKITFDFLGKDSIRYFNTVQIHPQAFKNMVGFCKGKKADENVFDMINSAALNSHLKQLMPGLSAKVFRTYNASVTLQEELAKLAQALQQQRNNNSHSTIKRKKLKEEESISTMTTSPGALSSSSAPFSTALSASPTTSSNSPLNSGDVAASPTFAKNSGGTAAELAGLAAASSKGAAGGVVVKKTKGQEEGEERKEKMGLLALEVKSESKQPLEAAQSGALGEEKAEHAVGGGGDGLKKKGSADLDRKSVKPEDDLLGVIKCDVSNVNELIQFYNDANRAVAVLCNHQRSIPKQHAASMQKLQNQQILIDEDIRECREYLQYLRTQKNNKKRKESEGFHFVSNLKDMEIARKSVVKEKMKEDACERRLQALLRKRADHELKMKLKDDNKTVALGTSKINYMDPRITVAFCKTYEIPIEKLFNKSLRLKFPWAMFASSDFVF